MGLAILLLAAIPAYLAAGVALLLGAGWLAALMILAGTGVACALGIGLFIHLRADRDAKPGRVGARAAAPGGEAGAGLSGGRVLRCTGDDMAGSRDPGAESVLRDSSPAADGCGSDRPSR